MGPVVAVHGGAGRWSVSPEEEAHVRRALEGAVDAGLAAVARGNAVDAVVEAVAYMEDSGVFNAGVGSVYTVSGRVQMDAGVMDGASGRAGAVAAVEDVKNPVGLLGMCLTPQTTCWWSARAPGSWPAQPAF